MGKLNRTMGSTDSSVCGRVAFKPCLHAESGREDVAVGGRREEGESQHYTQDTLLGIAGRTLTTSSCRRHTLCQTATPRLKSADFRPEVACCALKGERLPPSQKRATVQFWQLTTGTQTRQCRLMECCDFDSFAEWDKGCSPDSLYPPPNATVLVLFF